MKQIQKGFTLIELMIVVAIIGILAAVAIPAYQDYVVKAKLSKVQSTIDPVKLALAMYYQENGSFPVVTGATTATAFAAGDVWSSIGLSGLPNMPNEVSTIAMTNTATSAAITLTMANIKAGTAACTPAISTVDGCTVTMTGTPGATAIDWINTGTSTFPIVKKYFNY